VNKNLYNVYTALVTLNVQICFVFVCSFLKRVFIRCRNVNRMLTSLLLTLKQQQQNQRDPLKTELINAILRAAPDQLYYFLPVYSQSCTPRPTQAWLDTARFLHKVGYHLIRFRRSLSVCLSVWSVVGCSMSDFYHCSKNFSFFYNLEF